MLWFIDHFMNNSLMPLSNHPKRNKMYAAFLEECHQGNHSVDDIIDLGVKLMRKAGVHHHFFDDHSLLSTAKHLTHYALQTAVDANNDKQIKISENDAIKVIALLERRISERIPVEYITHEAYYCGHKFYVNENVLVPRSLMSTRFSDFLNETQWENHRVLDLCTGSGCIGITLALLNPHIQVDLADVSPKALEVARINVKNFALEDRVQCIESNLFENIDAKYDLIITNPPYVTISDFNRSPEEFKNEPELALAAGKDGLDIIHHILAQAKSYLNENGTLIAEVGFPAAKLLKKKYRKVPFKWYKYRRPSGKESLLGMHGVFSCPRAGLP